MKTIISILVALFITSSVALAGDTPNYIAIDYNVSGHHPPLTPAQMARIQQILARVKPCQRPLVRYAFVPHDRAIPFLVGEEDGLAFFFYTNDEDEAGEILHVFDTNNIYYREDVGLIPGMRPYPSIQQDIDEQPCPK